jgi:hypothetical protein
MGTFSNNIGNILCFAASMPKKKESIIYAKPTNELLFQNKKENKNT